MYKDWTGFYLGVHAGGGAVTGRTVDSEDTIFDDPEGDFDLEGFEGFFGGQLGFNHQIDNLIYGLEGDFSWIDFSRDRTMDDNPPNFPYVKAEMEWLATLRGRLGLATGNGMVYATAGVALAYLDHCANLDTPPCNTGNTDNIRWNGVASI